MNPSRASISVGFSLVLLVAASSANAQSYGQEDQVLTIGAAEFQPETPATDGHIDADGYLYYDGGGHDYSAPLALPEGALIEEICIYVNGVSFGSASLDVFAVKLVPGGGSPYEIGVHSLGFSILAGYGYYCIDALAYTVRSAFDLDGDEIVDNVVYYVKTQVGPSTAFGGVRITWKRQVSPPPATPTFNDVPASDLAFQHIEALVASGITAGCSAPPPPAPPLYCPDAPLTRRQMAVFLAKALGLHWAD